jgi:hypothetical protein
MSVDIKYKLTGFGWCDCTITVDGASASVTGSDLTDVLPEICNAAIQLLGPSESAEFSFEEEPGEFRCLLTSTGKDTANLKIYDLPDFGNEIASDGVKLIFDVQVGKRDFARAVHRAMSDVLRLHGKKGYLEKWDMAPFPSEQFASLAAALLAANHSLKADVPDGTRL